MAFTKGSQGSFEIPTPPLMAFERAFWTPRRSTPSVEFGSNTGLTTFRVSASTILNIVLFWRSTVATFYVSVRR